MKILHTADWHLGKRLDRFSRLAEQKEVLDELIQVAENHEVDVVLVAGDLFDAYNPSTEAIELLYRNLKLLTANGERIVVAIAGNHDSPDRIDAPDSLARACGIVFAGYPHVEVATGQVGRDIYVTHSEPGYLELKFPKYDYPLRLLLTPYANEYRMKTYLGAKDEEEELRLLLAQHWHHLADKYCDEAGVNILMAHLFMMKKGEPQPEEPEDEKPILHIGGAQAIYSENLPDQLQYVALGHLHRYQEIDKLRMPIIYSSSLLSYSFAEAGQQKYIVLVDVEPGQAANFERLAISAGKPLHRKRFEKFETAIDWLGEHPDAWVELTMVSDDFMHAEERRRLLQTHEGIVTIIPEIRNGQTFKKEEEAIDLSQSVDELFQQYFMRRTGQQPNQEILALFKEVRAEQIEE